MQLPQIEPYKIKMVESIQQSTQEQRKKWIKEASYNLFKLKSSQVVIDLITDSGTGAMSDKQWAEIMLGDESYAGSSSFLKLEKTVKNITGFKYFIPTHQGRAAENVLFSALVKEGDFIPGNAHFDTTKGHIEYRKATTLDCTIKEAFDLETDHPFKGNIDLQKLEQILKETPKGKIPFVLITITCNTVGGQPVSLDNIRSVRALCNQYQVSLFIDGARFAENAYFIKVREKEFNNYSITEIVKEIFSFTDGMTMSAKKDGIVNMGGFIALNDSGTHEICSNFAIMYEGFVTYGGMSGRDMGALSQGLIEGTSFEYLQSRIQQVSYLGQRLVEFNVPVLKPFGGHAVYIDATKFVPDIPKEEYRAQALAVELYIVAGIRSAEIGTLLADRDPITRKNRFPKLEMVRLAIPRRTYSLSQMEYVAIALKNIYETRKDAKSGYKIEWEAPIMRHFSVKLIKK
jgi:tryptophanase|tara:strand:+ start:27086 stop:28462 length:1377 start_codon:yes stop_codon:yes gene_type:complete